MIAEISLEFLVPVMLLKSVVCDNKTNILMAEAGIIIMCSTQVQYNYAPLCLGGKGGGICKQKIHEVKLKTRWEMYDYLHQHVNEVLVSRATQILSPLTFVLPQPSLVFGGSK